MKRTLALILLVSLTSGIAIGFGVRAALQPGPEQLAGMLTENPELVERMLTANPELMETLMSANMPQLALRPGGELQPVETEFEDWVYPDSKSTGSFSNTSGTINGQPFEFQTSTDAWTEDDVETVVGHYSQVLHDKAGIGEVDAWSLSLHQGGASSVNGVYASWSIDEFGSRPVRAGYIDVLAQNCVVHLTVSRGDDEDLTYIRVMFSKWSAAEPEQETH